MLRFLYALPLAVSLSLSGLTPIFAQEATAAEPGSMSVVERWRQDPTTVFDASEVDLEDFRWIARPLVIFAEAEQMPEFQQQISLIEEDTNELAVRDVVVVADTDPSTQSEARLRLRPRGFMLALMNKDGDVTLRKPFPWDVREISRSIDKMPARQREIQQGS